MRFKLQPLANNAGASRSARERWCFMMPLDDSAANTGAVRRPAERHPLFHVREGQAMLMSPIARLAARASAVSGTFWPIFIKSGTRNFDIS